MDILHLSHFVIDWPKLKKEFQIVNETISQYQLKCGSFRYLSTLLELQSSFELSQKTFKFLYRVAKENSLTFIQILIDLKKEDELDKISSSEEVTVLVKKTKEFKSIFEEKGSGHWEIRQIW